MKTLGKGSLAHRVATALIGLVLVPGVVFAGGDGKLPRKVEIGVRRAIALASVAVPAVVEPSAEMGADGPLTPLMNLRGRTDANGYLLTTSGAYSGADGPLTALANLRGRTDANGYLIVTMGAGPMLVGDGSASAPSYSFA